MFLSSIFSQNSLLLYTGGLDAAVEHFYVSITIWHWEVPEEVVCPNIIFWEVSKVSSFFENTAALNKVLSAV